MERWLITYARQQPMDPIVTPGRRSAPTLGVPENLEIHEHPADWLKSQHRTVLLFALKLMPEDPELG